jgi:hypothetical protein
MTPRMTPGPLGGPKNPVLIGETLNRSAES